MGNLIKGGGDSLIKGGGSGLIKVGGGQPDSGQSTSSPPSKLEQALEKARAQVNSTHQFSETAAPSQNFDGLSR